MTKKGFEMADIKTITINNVEYDLKDETARAAAATIESGLGDLAHKSSATGSVTTITPVVTGENLSFASTSTTVTVS